MPQEPRRPIAIDGANELTLRGLWWVLRRWPRLRAEMVSSDGYIWHHCYFRPTVLGLVSYWADEASARRFAHQPVHREFWRWAEGNRSSLGGWLAIYEYRRGGALWGNGVPVVRKHFEPHFAAVADADAARERPGVGDRPGAAE